jgi:hypothetical protein
LTATPPPTPEALAIFEELLKGAHASVEQAKNAIDDAIHDTESARDEARSLFDTAAATSSFSESLGDLHFVARVTDHALSKLPAIDEGAAAEAGDTGEETS